MSPVLRAVLGILALVVVVWLLFTVVFPWVDREFLIDPTLSALLTSG